MNNDEITAADRQRMYDAEEIILLRARVAELEDELVENDGVIRLLRRHRDSAEARVAELEAAESRLRARMAREADAPEGQRYLWVREIVDLLSGRLQ